MGSADTILLGFWACFEPSVSLYQKPPEKIIITDFRLGKKVFLAVYVWIFPLSSTELLFFSLVELLGDWMMVVMVVVLDTMMAHGSITYFQFATTNYFHFLCLVGWFTRKIDRE